MLKRYYTSLGFGTCHDENFVMTKSLRYVNQCMWRFQYSKKFTGNSTCKSNQGHIVGYYLSYRTYVAPLLDNSLNLWRGQVTGQLLTLLRKSDTVWRNVEIFTDLKKPYGFVEIFSIKRSHYNPVQIWKTYLTDSGCESLRTKFYYLLL